jgi:hypothetical protein
MRRLSFAGVNVLLFSCALSLIPTSLFAGAMPQTFQIACTISGLKNNTAYYNFTKQQPDLLDFAAKYSLTVNWEDKRKGARSYSCSNVSAIRMAGTVIMTLDGCPGGGVQIVTATDSGGVISGVVRNQNVDYTITGHM